MMMNGVLTPNSELGHLELDGTDAELRASNSAREREGLSFEQWGHRLTHFLGHVERLFSPELFVLGGGVSRQHEEFFPYLRVETPLKPAELLNNAGIVGSALLAQQPSHWRAS
jgi:polyphosphate glucokinase